MPGDQGVQLAKDKDEILLTVVATPAPAVALLLATISAEMNISEATSPAPVNRACAPEERPPTHSENSAVRLVDIE